MKVRVPLLLTAAIAATALALGGCGGGGDDHSGSTAASTGTADTEASRTQAGTNDGAGTTRTSTTGGSKDSFTLGSPADVPHSKGGDNSIQNFGSEASEADRAEAGRVLAEYNDDLAGGDTDAACDLLASGTREKIEQTLKQLGEQGSGGSNLPTSCAQVLKLTSNVGSRTPQLRLSELLSLRQLGAQAFLIYKAGDGRVYAIGMNQEDGGWKVGAVTASPLGA